MTTTLAPAFARTSPPPGADLAHIGLADPAGRSVTGHALCGFPLRDRRVEPARNRQICVVCLDLAGGDWEL